MMIANLGKWIKDLYSKSTAHFTQIQIGHYFDCLVISIIVAISFFSLDPGLDSSWGIIDDHEIMYFSPAHHPMGFSEIIPTLLTKTEINPDSTVSRFRPAYFTLRLIETRIWSTESPFPWYLARIVLFILFIFVTYLLFKKINGRVIGGLLVLQVATFNFWSGIFSRLGPAETYAILGLSLFFIGILTLSKNKRSNFAWLIIMVGTIIAIGSKENMVIFLLPEIYLLILFLRKPFKNNIFPIAMVAFSIIWTIWIFTTVLIRIKANGSDVYGNSVGIFSRLSILGDFVTQNLFFTVFIGILIVVGILGLLLVKNATMKPRFLYLIFGGAGIIALISSQKLFYSGSIWGRYNFPYALFLPVTISLAANFVQNLPFFNKKYLYFFTTLAMSAILILFFINPSNLLVNRKIANEGAFATNQFKSDLQDIEYFLLTNPSSTIVLYGDNPEYDYERIVSIIRFIRSDAFAQDIFVYNDSPADFEATYSPLYVSLEKGLIQLSQNGNPDEGIKPINEYYKSPNNCVLINFSKVHPIPITCESVINMQ